MKGFERGLFFETEAQINSEKAYRIPRLPSRISKLTRHSLR